LATSWISSEDVAPTGGRYGSVTVGALWMALVTHVPEFPLRQIYSFTRVATLVAVILNFVALDIMTPIDCQVGSAFQVASSPPHSDWPRSPGLASHRICKSHMMCSSLRGSEQLEFSVCLDLQLLGRFRRFTLDYISDVRLLFIRARTIFPTEHSSWLPASPFGTKIGLS
jgi:hypothetical protein